jgi:tyrosine-protein kinase Etk/Wzc
MDFSSKGNIRFANNLMQQNKLNNMLLVINDVADFHRGYGYGYGYGFGYGYGNKKKSKRRKKN